MELYTINNVYPSRNFNFTVDYSTISGKPIIHTHSINEVTSLTTTLNSIPNLANAIVINDNVFIRDEDNDDAVEEMYAWTNSDLDTTYKTQSSVPTVGTSVYDASGNLLSDVSITAFVIGHTHSCLSCFIGNDRQKVYGDVTISSDNATLTISASTISINYVSLETGIVAGILENNKNDSIGILQLYHGDIRDIPNGIDTNILAI